MGYFKHYLLFLAVASYFAGTLSQNDPASDPGGSPPAPAAGGSPPASGSGTVIDLDATTTTSPDDIAMDGEIADLRVKQCFTLFGDCWVALKMRKSYLKEEKRLKICLRRTHGFMVCEQMTEDQAKEAQTQTEELLKLAWEEKLKNDEKEADEKILHYQQSKDVRKRAVQNKDM